MPVVLVCTSWAQELPFSPGKLRTNSSWGEHWGTLPALSQPPNLPHLLNEAFLICQTRRLLSQTSTRALLCRQQQQCR